MAAPVPTVEPVSIVAGDTAKWKRSLADYPANESWALTYALTKSGTRITFSASADGADHLVNVLAATTAAWTVGKYAAQGYVTKSTDRFLVFTGEIEIKTNLATQSSGYDGRSHAKKCVDAIETVLESRAGKEVQNWSGLEQSFSLIPTADLIKLRDRYLTEYRSEQQADRVAKGLGTRRNVFARFSKVA